MFPIRDHNPSGRIPFVTYTIVALNILIFLAFNVRLGFESDGIYQIFGEWGMVPGFITRGMGWETLITSQFLHGGFMHIAGNMLFLWIYGDNMEDKLGHLGFLGFYLVCGVLAALAQWVVDPMSMIPTIGASGAIAGVMGGYLLLFPKAKIDILLILIVFFRVFSIPAWILLGLWFVMQLGNGVISDPNLGGVAYWAHAGGFVIGMILTVPVWLRLGGRSFWQVNHMAPPHPEAEYELSESRIPRVRRK